MMSGREGTVSNNLHDRFGKSDASKPAAPDHLLLPCPTEVGIPQEDRELSLLWQRFAAALGAMDVGPQHWPLDGWLHLDGEPQPPFPVILVQFNADGVGVVLGMEHPVPPGQIADLTTQAHGAGCQHRTVRCQGREAYFRALTLQYAALRFDPEA
jgi:hypothetical protein